MGIYISPKPFAREHPKYKDSGDLNMTSEVTLGNVMVDCDDERKLQTFYSKLLGWEMCELFARPAVRSSSGIVFLFVEEEGSKNRCILIFRLTMLWKWLKGQNC